MALIRDEACPPPLTEAEGFDQPAADRPGHVPFSLPTAHCPLAAAHATHELRNTLTSIISSAECLRRRITDPQHRKYVDDIIRTARRGATSLSKIDACASHADPVGATRRGRSDTLIPHTKESNP